VNVSPATHCVLCGGEAVLAPRVHVREMRAGAPPRDVALGVCETHGVRLRKGELRVLQLIEGWLGAEGRLSTANPLSGLRVLVHCLACDAPLAPPTAAAAPFDLAGSQARRLPSGEVVVECTACPAINVIEPVGGDPVAVRLHTRPPRPPGT
jgi:hypothetical protein